MRPMKRIETTIAFNMATRVCGHLSEESRASRGWGTELFLEISRRVSYALSDNGGEPEVLVSIKPEDGTPYGPQIIGDVKTVLFTLAPVASTGRERWDRADIVVQPLQSREPRKTAGIGVRTTAGEEISFAP